MKIKTILIIVLAVLGIGIFIIALSGVLLRQAIDGAKPNVTININQPESKVNLEQIERILQNLLAPATAKPLPSPEL